MATPRCSLDPIALYVGRVSSGVLPWSLLADDEQQRALSYVDRAASARFILGRGVLRAALAEREGLKPSDVRMISECNRPRPDPRWGVSVSHAGDLIVVAVAYAAVTLGVDVAELVPRGNLRSIARRFFHADEVAQLDPLADEPHTASFYAAWVRKEALGKAAGRGLTPDVLASLLLVPEQSAVIVSLEDRLWTIMPIGISDTHMAALAIEGAWNDRLPAIIWRSAERLLERSGVVHQD